MPFVKGHKHSEETKRKLSEANKRRLKDRKNHPMYNKKHSEESKRKMSLAKRGKKSIHWKGGISQNYYKRLIKFEDISLICEFCDTKKNVCIHHKDHDRQNNERENLMFLCRSCHAKEHNIIPPLRVGTKEWIVQMGES